MATLITAISGYHFYFCSAQHASHKMRRIFAAMTFFFNWKVIQQIEYNWCRCASTSMLDWIFPFQIRFYHTILNFPFFLIWIAPKVHLFFLSLFCFDYFYSIAVLLIVKLRLVHIYLRRKRRLEGIPSHDDSIKANLIFKLLYTCFLRPLSLSII